MVRPSMASADASANDGTPRRGVSLEERRRLRSLLCGVVPPAYFEVYAHVRVRFKLAPGLGEPWTREGRFRKDARSV